MIITSLQNPRVKQIVALRDRRDRERARLMRVEGYEELALALACDAQPLTLFFCPGLFREQSQIKLIERIGRRGTEVIEVSDRVFAKMAYRENPDGWLATFAPVPRALEHVRLGSDPFVVVAEAVEKPGNLGAMLRTADAAGVDAVIAAAPITDWGNPNIVRASKGTLFSVQVAEVDSDRALAWLREHAVQIVAATPQAATAYTEANMRGPVAIAVGSEKHGLSPMWIEAADVQVRIPMRGRVNSLNVATAAALLVYEALRQRTT